MSKDGKPTQAAKDIARKDIKDSKEDDRTGSAPVRVAAVTPTAVVADAPAPGSTEPIKPNAVKTVIVHPGSMQTASLSPLPSDNRQLTPAPAVANAATITTINTVKSEVICPATAAASAASATGAATPSVRGRAAARR